MPYLCPKTQANQGELSNGELLTERLILPVTKTMLEDIKNHRFEARHESKFGRFEHSSKPA